MKNLNCQQVDNIIDIISAYLAYVIEKATVLFIVLSRAIIVITILYYIIENNNLFTAGRWDGIKEVFKGLQQTDLYNSVMEFKGYLSHQINKMPLLAKLVSPFVLVGILFTDIEIENGKSAGGTFLFLSILTFLACYFGA